MLANCAETPALLQCGITVTEYWYLRRRQHVFRPFAALRCRIADSFEQVAEFGSWHEYCAQAGQVRRYDLAVKYFKLLSGEVLR